MKDLLRDAQEQALYNLMSKGLNDYISRNPLPPYRLLRILNIIASQIINSVEKEQEK